MQPIQLHPVSLAAGFGIAALAFLVMSQAPTPAPNPALVTRAPQFAVHPRDYVQILEGVPYAVPPGKILTITALGIRNYYHVNPARLVVNGVVELEMSGNYTNVVNSNNASIVGSIREVPRGFTIPAGSVVQVLGGDVTTPEDCRAWGFIADA
jgi:hypothetical protein